MHHGGRLDIHVKSVHVQNEVQVARVHSLAFDGVVQIVEENVQEGFVVFYEENVVVSVCEEHDRVEASDEVDFFVVDVFVVGLEVGDREGDQRVVEGDVDHSFDFCRLEIFRETELSVGSRVVEVHVAELLSEVLVLFYEEVGELGNLLEKGKICKGEIVRGKL